MTEENAGETDEEDNGADSDDDAVDAILRAVAKAPPRIIPGGRAATDTTKDTKALEPGVKVGGFRILSRLGAGGMGVVYRAEDERLRREVALKVIGEASSDELVTTARRRFLREARAAAAVNHPNVATVYEVGEEDGRIFIAMEIASGTTLRSLLEKARSEKQPLDINQALDIGRQIARGLAKAHEKGIVHRDLKPDNIMVGDELVKVLDFGLARIDEGVSPEIASSTATAPNEIAGTPGYMSPEQTMGKPTDVRTDVFAFGVVLYEMLSGVRPFIGDSAMALAIAIARDPHAPLSTHRADVAPELEAIVNRCLEKAPNDRYSNAREALDALEAFLLRASSPSLPTSTNVVDRQSSTKGPSASTTAADSTTGIQAGVGAAAAAATEEKASRLPRSLVLPAFAIVLVAALFWRSKVETPPHANTPSTSASPATTPVVGALAPSIVVNIEAATASSASSSPPIQPQAIASSSRPTPTTNVPAIEKVLNPVSSSKKQNPQKQKPGDPLSEQD